MPVSLRHLVPFVFVLSLTASVGLSFFFPFFGWLFLFAIGLYFLVGIYFSTEIANKIIYLLDNPDKAKQLGDMGRQLIEKKYSWENESKKLLKTYEEICTK